LRGLISAHLTDAETAILNKFDGPYEHRDIYVDEFPPVEVLDELIARNPNAVSGKEWGSAMEITGYRKIDPATGLEEEFSQTNKSTFSK
jgi:hypothetical protein